MRKDKFANITIHFDSLFESLKLIGIPEKRMDFCDVTYFKVIDRFFSLAEKYNIKFTIFVIGRDLESPEIFSRVRNWFEMGHEIGNHSYNHIHNLGMLPYNEIEKEVMKSHELISRCIGEQPKGFASPAWSISLNLIDILTKANYVYDASMFPSYFIQLFSLKSFFTTSKKNRFGPFCRCDKLAGILANQNPYFISTDSLIKKSNYGLLEFPIPTTRFLRIPCYHTMYFIFGNRFFNKVIKSCLNRYDFFYYVMHPLDLFNHNKDVSYSYDLPINNIERATIPFRKKRLLVEEALEIIANERKFITLRVMAQKIIDKYLID